MGLLEETYYFLTKDLRYEVVEPNPGPYPVWPFIQMYDSQDLHWWSGDRLAPTKPVDFTALEGTPQDEASFARMKVASTHRGPLLRDALADIVRPFAPADAQFIPSYIKTDRGPFEFEEGWHFLHLWKLRDLVDDAKSARYTLRNGKVRNRYDQIVLKEDEVLAIPESERLILRVASLDTIVMIFHRQVVDAMLSFGIDGALFLPLSLYRVGPVLRPETLEVGWSTKAVHKKQ